MKKLCILLIILSFSQMLSAQRVINDFENWDTVLNVCYETELIALGVLNPDGGSMYDWDLFSCGRARTTDSHTGYYSLLLHNWYVDAKGMVWLEDSITERPSFFQGFYKYIKGGPHVAWGFSQVVLTKWNGTNRDTIAIGSIQFDSTDFYIPFQMSFNYLSAQTPDTFNIMLLNAVDGSGRVGLVSNLLYLDDFVFSNTPLAVEQLDIDKDVSVFPNPVYDQLNVVSRAGEVDLVIYNSIGEIIFEDKFSGAVHIDLSNFPEGCYYYRLSKGAQTTSGKFIKL